MDMLIKIDFDEASAAWKKNKKSIGNGQYKYICMQKTKAGKSCKRESLKFCDYCKMHIKNEDSLIKIKY
jgi:hypothetical protein